MIPDCVLAAALALQFFDRVFPLHHALLCLSCRSLREVLTSKAVGLAPSLTSTKLHRCARTLDSTFSRRKGNTVLPGGVASSRNHLSRKISWRQNPTNQRLLVLLKVAVELILHGSNHDQAAFGDQSYHYHYNNNHYLQSQPHTSGSIEWSP